MTSRACLSKMQWDVGRDDEQALRWIIKLAGVLARLRCSAHAWDSKNQDLDYGFRHSQPQALDRPVEILRNLARGHALHTGRNSITLEDIPIVAKTALSPAIIDRVNLLCLLMDNNGTLVAREIMDALRQSQNTARKNMKELWAVGLAELIDDTTTARYRQRVTLEKEFEW